MIQKKSLFPIKKSSMTLPFSVFTFQLLYKWGLSRQYCHPSSQFFLEFLSLSLGIQYTLYMDAKFHKRDAVAIYKQLDKENFSWLIHSYIKIEYKFVRTTAVQVYWESLAVGQQYTYMMLYLFLISF